MRLSEAIRLGSLTIDKPEACNVEACAIGMALSAIGRASRGGLSPYADIEAEWPWIASTGVVECPWCKDGYTMGGNSYPAAILYHPFDSHVMGGDITIEQLADWIASIEPPEPIERLESTLDELTEKADEVLAAYLPPDWTKERWVRAMAEHRQEGE